ncbi:MAG: hypothetical protein KDI15_00140, partial [Thiothrix sp.]|nr:hypothetical protein [Thiothrix sp.]
MQAVDRYPDSHYSEAHEVQIQIPEFSTPLCKVIRRNGEVTDFNAGKIHVALTKAFLDVEGSSASGSVRIHDTVEALTQQV